MKKSIYEILKQSFYEINEHYMKFISAFALQAFLLFASIMFLPPFGIVLAFLIMVITCIGMARYSLRIINKKQEQIKQVVEINKFTVSHIITYIIKTFQIAFFALFLIIPGILKWLEYSQVDFVLADNEKLDTNEALLESRKLTHNSKGRVLMLCVTNVFLSLVLISFSASIVLLSTLVIQLSQTALIVWFSAMSAFLLCVIAMPFHIVSRTLLYENLKAMNKFNKVPKQNFLQEVAQEFMTAFKTMKKENKPKTTSKPKNTTSSKTSQTASKTKKSSSTTKETSKTKNSTMEK